MGIRDLARNKFWFEALVYDRGCERGRPWGVTFDYPAEVRPDDTATEYGIEAHFIPSTQSAEMRYATDSGLLEVDAVTGTFKVTGAGTGRAAIRAYSVKYPDLQQVLWVDVTEDAPVLAGDFSADYSGDFY